MHRAPGNFHEAAPNRLGVEAILSSSCDWGISEIERALIIMAEETWKDYREKKHSKPSPLKGIRVLEVCTLVLGPSGPGILSRLGAEVIKCEMPPLGDTLRSLVPFGYFFREQSTSLFRPNPNKYWPGLDLHTPEGQEKNEIREDTDRCKGVGKFLA